MNRIAAAIFGATFLACILLANFVTSRYGMVPVGFGLTATAGPFCIDNGCFSDRWDEAKWWAFLVANAHAAGSCLFAVAPDVVADAANLPRLLAWTRLNDQLDIFGGVA